MKFRTTLIAALLLGLFGAYVYFFEFKKAQEEEKKEEEQKKVLSVDWEKVTGLKVKDSHGTFVMEKEAKDGTAGAGKGGGQQEWRILEPLKTEADGSTLNGMVNALKNLRVDRVVVESPQDLAPFGLDDPPLQIEVRLPEREKAPPMLRVGRKSPVGHNSYAQRAGEDKVLLLSTFLNTQFDKSLYDLREKKLFRFDQEDVERVRVLRKGTVRVEMAKEEGAWKMTLPIQAKASETEVNKILNKLTGLRVRSFEKEDAEDLSPFKLAKPAWQVEVSLAPDHTKASLLLAEKMDKDEDVVYAKRGETPQVVTVQSDVLNALDVEPDDLREKKVFAFDSWKVKKVDLNWKDRHVTLEKKDEGKWWITDPMEARAASGKISTFLSSLSRLEGEAFMGRPDGEDVLASYGLVSPLVRITPYTEDESSSEEEEGGPRQFTPLGTLLLGKGTGEVEGCYALLDGEDTVARVGEDFFEKDLPGGTEDLREKKLLDFFRYQIAAIRYEGPEGTVVLEKKKGSWQLEKPTSRDAEEKDVDNLVSVLTDIEAVRFLEKNDQGETRAKALLEQPHRVFTLENDQGEELGTLIVSAKGPEGEEGLLYAQLKGDPWIGLIEASDEKDLVDGLSPFLEKE